MAYNFGMINFAAFNKAKQWLKAQAGTYTNGKPPVDNASDNNYQYYADNALTTGAIPTFKECNASNQFEITSGHTLVDSTLTINATSVPATPTGAVNGTAGTTSYGYAVVGRAGSLQAPSAAVTVATGNATLTATNSITITFVPTPGFLIYDVYRTASAGTPSTTGRIGMVSAGFATANVTTPTLTFTDTGLVADGSTIPSTNTTGAITGDVSIYGNLALNALATPATPIAAVNGTAGTSTISYKVVARCGSPTTATGHTAASAAVSPSTCNATLSATNSVTLTWQPVVGAVSYDVYRTATNGTAPTTTGLIGSTFASTFTDTGLAGDSASAPNTNTTGVSAVLTSTSPGLVSIVDTNGNPEILFTATSSAVNGLTEINSATGNGVNNAVQLNASGADAAVGLSFAPKGAAGILTLGLSSGTGTITVGSSSAAQTVTVANGAGAPTITVANTSTAGATVTVAGAATAGAAVDTINLATGNAATTAAKKVNIATGVPNTSGNNQVVIGGGAKSAVTLNAVLSSYQATNYIATTGGSANALTATLNNAAGAAVTVAAGLRITVLLGAGLQAGGNTFNLNSHGTDAVKLSTNPANNIGTAYVTGSIVDMCFDGTVWQVIGT